MTIYKIITPNKDFSGDRAGVVFTAGFGVTSDQARADELRAMGYCVVPNGVTEIAEPLDDALAVPPAPIVAEPNASVTSPEPGKRARKARH